MQQLWDGLGMAGLAFEPHRLPLDKEYTTMPFVAERLADRWSGIPTEPVPIADDLEAEALVPRDGGWAKLDVEC